MATPLVSRFRVSASLFSGTVDQPATIEACNPVHAARIAIQRRKIPIEILRTRSGTQAVYWSPDFFPRQPCPEVVRVSSRSGHVEVLLGWGDANDAGSILLIVQHLVDDDGGPADATVRDEEVEFLEESGSRGPTSA